MDGDFVYRLHSYLVRVFHTYDPRHGGQNQLLANLAEKNGWQVQINLSPTHGDYYNRQEALPYPPGILIDLREMLEFSKFDNRESIGSVEVYLVYNPDAGSISIGGRVLLDHKEFTPIIYSWALPPGYDENFLTGCVDSLILRFDSEAAKYAL